MKFLLLLTSLMLPLGLSYKPNSVSFEAKKAQNSNKIQNFNDFIATDDELKDYYGDIKYLAGEDLINALENIISQNNTKPSYDGKVPGSSKIWSSYYLLDRDYELSPLTEQEIINLEKDADCWWNVQEVYCDVLYEPESLLINRNNLNKGTNKISIDREHVLPKSYGFNGSGSYSYDKTMAGCDMHNLHMGESESNQHGHSDYVYGNVASNKTAFTSLNSNKVGSYNGTHETYKSNTVFEPIDRNKGDIARSVLYMGTRYHTYKEIAEQGSGPSPRILLGDNPYKFASTVNPDETKDNDTIYGILSDILSWNTFDEVSDHEKIRNTLCQKFIQGNRNPFIDFPLWADAAFNPNSIYFADIDSPNGVVSKPFLEGVDEEYYEGDILDFNEITFNFKSGTGLDTIPNNELTFILKNLDTNEETTIEDNVVLSVGNYELIAKQIVGDVVLKETSVVFKVLSISDTLSVATNLKNQYKTSSSIDLKNVKFQYSYKGQKIVVPYDELTYTLTNKLTNKSEQINDGYVFKEPGNFTLKISYTTKENIELSTEVDLEVKKAPFYEDENFLKLLLIIGGVVLLLILIILIIVIIKKSRKHK